MLVLINVEMVARYVFNTSTLIADEYGGYLFVWITMVGCGHACCAPTVLCRDRLVDRVSPGDVHAIGIGAAWSGS